MKQAELTVSGARATDKHKTATVRAALDTLGTRRFLTRRAQAAARKIEMPLDRFVQIALLTALSEIEDTGGLRVAFAYRAPHRL